MTDLMSNNCNVLSTTDTSHIAKMTPLQIKRKELAVAASMVEPLEREQEIQNQPKRELGHSRPLGGRE
jgi:hypothetical protein